MTSTSKEESVEEDTNVVTMVDVLKEEQELEDDAKAVLGASDDQNCTYSQVNAYQNYQIQVWKMAVLAYNSHMVHVVNVSYFPSCRAKI